MQSTIEKWPFGLKHVVLLEALCKSAWTGGRLANPGSLEKHACGDTSAKWNVQWVLKQPCHFSLLLFELFYHDLFHGTHTRGLYIASSVLYRVCYWASLLHQKSNTYGAGYVMQMLKCVSLLIMHYSKSVLRSREVKHHGSYQHGKIHSVGWPAYS